jgi:hypothetical protein
LKVAARTKHEYYLVGQCLRGAERSIGYHHPDYEQDYASQTSLRRTASAPQGYHHPKAHGLVFLIISVFYLFFVI